MKKITSFMLAASLAAVSLGTAAQEGMIAVTVDNRAVVFPDQEPVMVEERVLVPVRGVFEALGAKVSYLPADGQADEQVDIQKGEVNIRFSIGSREVQVKKPGTEEKHTLDVSTQLIQDRTMVPIRFVSETIGYRVEWNEAGNRVEIFSPQPEEPVQPAAIQQAARVAPGKSGGLLIRDDGTVWTWRNDAQSRTGNTDKSEEPVQVSGIESAVAVACGRKSMYALKADGTVWSWGSNAYGQLGRETPEDIALTPERIPGLENIVEISAGEDFALALDKNGRVWSWGRNLNGQLGLGDEENRNAPEIVQAIEKRVISVAAGSGHGAAVTEDQQVWLWGSNSMGQLGKRKGILRQETPAVLSSVSRLTRVAAGGIQTLALRPDGSIYAWGSTYVGEAPEGTPEEKNLADEDGFYRYDEPKRMRFVYYDMDREEDLIKILTDAEMISCGDEHAVALSKGKIYVWGDSVLMPYRLKDQIWRFYAQEYTGVKNARAVYAGKNREFYALDSEGVLWRVDEDGKAPFFSLKN